MHGSFASVNNISMYQQVGGNAREIAVQEADAFVLNGGVGDRHEGAGMQ